MNDLKPVLSQEEFRAEHMDNLALCINRSLKIMNTWLASHTNNPGSITPDQMQRVAMCLKDVVSMRYDLDVLVHPELSRAYSEHISYYNRPPEPQETPKPN